jgi:hypothetical protein
MENERCCHGKERFFKFDLNTLRHVLNEQNWLPIKKKNFLYYARLDIASEWILYFVKCVRLQVAVMTI